MMLAKLLLYLCVGLIAIVDIVLFIRLIEFMACVLIMRQTPLAPSCAPLRRAVVDVVRGDYPHARTVCEIGAGYGGLGRAIARATRTNVTEIENMPVAALVGWIRNMFCARVRMVWADAFRCLDSESQTFDVAVTYLGPEFVTKLMAYRGRFRVLISLDFPAMGVSPTRVIDVGYGYTRYWGHKYPHRLYVYEF